MKPVRLMYAASGHDADMLYATGFYADDAFLWWEVRGRGHLALSPLEIDRAKPVARGRVHAVSEFLPKGPQELDGGTNRRRDEINRPAFLPRTGTVSRRIARATARGETSPQGLA